MDSHSDAIPFSRSAIEISRFIMGLHHDSSNVFLRCTALVAMDALGNGHQFAMLRDYAGKCGMVNGEILQMPEYSVWIEAMAKLAADPEQRVITRIQESGEIPRTPLIMTGDDRIYLQRNYQAEWEIALKWIELHNNGNAKLQYNTKFAGELFNHSGERNEEQCSAVVNAVENRFTFITGGPGTGKTTVLAKILLLELQRNPKLRFVLCAPTGKGQARIAESLRSEVQTMAEAVQKMNISLEPLLHPECSTVHSLLSRNRGEIFPYDLLVMDEGSMASLPLMAQFFGQLSDSARVLICGDRNQLPSVDEGAVVSELYRTGSTGPLSGIVSELKKNFRSEGSPHIVGFSSEIPELNDPQAVEDLARRMLSCSENDFIGIPWDDRQPYRGMEAFLQRLIDGDREIFGPDGSPFAEIVRLAHQEPTVNALNRAFELLDNFKILCAVREGRYGVKTINDAMAKSLHLNSDAAPGMPVIITGNDWKHTRLCNGDCGIIWKKDDCLLAYFPGGDGEYRKFAIAELPPWEPVFAMTIHKSQGSGYRNAAIIIPGYRCPVVNRELVYTAITRARKRVILAAAPEPLAEGLARRVMRNSAICEIIEGQTRRNKEK